MLIKLGEAVAIKPEDFHPLEKLASDADLDIEKRMFKFAQELKVIAPQAKDFLYFTAIMMHAAEAALLNEDGSPKLMANGEPVTAVWEKVGKESIKWVCSDKSIKPYKNSNCFIAGTQILMSDGSVKNIEDIIIGDEVITHKNRIKKVTKTFINQYTGDLVNFKIANSLPISCTLDHPFFAINRKSIDTNIARSLKSNMFDCDFIKANDLNKGSLLLAPVLNNIFNDSEINENKARLLGLFSAEGSFNNNSVVFSFGYHEENTLAKDTCELIEKEFNIKPKIKVCNQKATVSFSNKEIANFFEKHVGLYSHGKKLSSAIVYGSSNIKTAFITGWLEGDGGIDKYSGKIIGTTVSKDLANQIRVILNSLHINNTFYTQKPSKSLLKSGRFIVGKHIVYRIKIPYNEGFVFTKNSNKLNSFIGNVKFVKLFRFIDNYRIHTILSKNYLPYNGSVYNIEVEDDHSYVANGLIVHNCDIFPKSELKEAYKDWVGKPLCLDHQSQSVDKIRGVIVDTVYDEKRERIIALCALDKKNYPDLADKVTSGVSKDVSMGVAVNRAICSECHTVARTEKDFCQHMKLKSCYGEINMGLSPMELSLVVNGADKKAKVKHIIASDVSVAAALLENYLQIKEASKEISTQDLESIKDDLTKLTDKIDGLVDGMKEDESDAVGPTCSHDLIEEDLDNSSSIQMNAPEAFPTYASDLQRAILGAQVKIASLQENLFRLTKKNEEPTMSKKNAYFQGTEEPTPGQKKYPVDPLNDKARQMDKTLVGPTPFPGVGDIEGMYPGDEQVKKELQRLADENERAMFRESALKKAKEQLQSRGYFQGTTEPKEKGPTYTPDPLNEKDRMLDKQMVGKSPFPGVGKVDGLYGDDLATKEKLSRASLKARFEKIATPDGRIDKSASRWVVLAGDRQILAATVNQITKGNSDSLYDAVATERFGKSLLSRIQTEGFKATASSLLQTTAQAAPPPPAPVAPPPAPAMEDDLVPPEVVGDEGGDPEAIVEDLQDLENEMGAKLTELKDSVSGPVAEDAEGLDAVPTAGDDAFAPTAAPKTASQLQSMRKRVNGMLQEGISETITSLANHIREIKTARKVYKESYASMNGKQRNYLNNLTVEAVKDAKAMLGDTSKLMEAVVKYAQGTAELQKRAQEIAPAYDVEGLGLGNDEFGSSPLQTALELGIITEDSIGGPIELTSEALDDGWDIKTESGEEYNPMTDKEIINVNEDEKTITVSKELDFNKENEDGEISNEEVDDMGLDLEELLKDTGDAMDAKYTPAKGGDPIPVELEGGSISLASKQNRAEARIKLAQKGLLGFNDLSQQAHPKGSASAVDAGNLDIKPTVPGAAFHVQKDLEKAMLDLANMPPKVRKQAEQIQTLVAEGKLAGADVDQLVSHGVDAEAVKYWKALWGASKDSEAKDYANKLTQEHASAKKAEEDSAYKGKVKRAYEMANQMVTCGMIAQSQVDYQVDEILKYNDAGFNSVKSLLSKQAMKKQASVPVVGLMDAGQVYLPMAPPTQSTEMDLQGCFDSYFQGKKL
jgi:intein/homing endonuclease